MIGSMLILFGMGFGIFGKRIFGVLSAMTIAIFCGLFILYLFMAFFEFMKSTTATIITLSAVAVMVVVVTLVLKRRFSLNITVLCALAGFNIGTLLYALIYQISSWESFAAAITFALVFASAGAIKGYLRRGRKSSLTWTLGILAGSQLTRGLSLLIGGYPLDPVIWTLLQNDMPLTNEVTPLVWLYFALTCLLTLGFSCWLATYQDEHCDPHLVQYFEDFIYDDSFVRQSTVSLNSSP